MGESHSFNSGSYPGRFKVDKAAKKEELIEAAVRPLIERNGYEYVGAEIKRSGKSTELIVYADREGGLSLDDCEEITRLIDPVIDALDPVDGAYYLCVSSPGLDRELKTQNDFRRAMGKKVDVRLYAAERGKKEFTGELTGYDGGGFEISVNGEILKFTHKQTAAIRMHVDF